MDDTILIHVDRVLTEEQRQHVRNLVENVRSTTGEKILIAEKDTQIEIDRNYGPKLDALIKSQEETNTLLRALVDVLAEESEEEEQPQTYLDGSKVQ